MTQQLDDVITALESQLEHDKAIIESSKQAIALAKARLREANKLIMQLKKVRGAGGHQPLEIRNYPCSQCDFKGATPAGLSLHITVKHAKRPPEEPAPAPDPQPHVDTVDEKIRKALGGRGEGESTKGKHY